MHSLQLLVQFVQAVVQLLSSVGDGAQKLGIPSQKLGIPSLGSAVICRLSDISVSDISRQVVELCQVNQDRSE